MVEYADQAPHQRFVVRRELDRPPSPVRSSREIATRLALLDQSLCGSRCRFPEARAFALEPALELGPIRDEEPLQQRAPVEVEGLPRSAAVDRTIEGSDVTPDAIDVQPHLLIAAAHDGPGPQGSAQHAERLAQGRARVLLVEFRPEQGDEAVAAVQAGRCGGGEVGEEGEAPRLSEERPHLAPIGSGEAQSPEHAELDHARPRWHTRRHPEIHARPGGP